MSESDSIRVVFDWQPGEHAEMLQVLVGQQFRGAAWRIGKWAGGFVLAGWLLIVVLNAVLYADLTTFFAGLPWLIFVGFWLWIFRRLLGPAQARQATGMSADVNYPFVHTFDDSGLRIEGFSSAVELKWGGMTRVQEEDGFFMFYWNPKCAYFTPKRTMSLDDQNRLRELSTKKLGADAKVRDLMLPPSGRQ